MHLIRSVYAASVRYADSVLEGLFERLRTDGFLENTLIVITADHGEGLGEHGLWAHQLSVYDTLIKIPLILCSPELPRGAVREEPVQLSDLFPTLLTVADAPLHRYALQTHRPSLLESISRPSEDPSDQYAFSEFYDDGGGLTRRLQTLNPSFDTSALAGLYGVRSRQFKYIEAAKGQHALFDCLQDPNEQRNLIGNPPPIIDNLRQALADWRSSLQDFGIHYPASPNKEP